MSEKDIQIPKMPATYYVGRSELVAWLKEWGIKPNHTRLLIESGSIPSHSLPGNVRVKKYIPSQVRQLLNLPVE